MTAGQTKTTTSGKQADNQGVPHDSEITINVVRTADELAAIADSYDRLLESCGPWTWPARSGWAFEMLGAWDRDRDQGNGANTLFILLASRQGKLIGALPLQLSRKRRGPLSLNQLYGMGGLPGSAIAIGHPVLAVQPGENFSSVLLAFYGCLSNMRPTVWDVLEIDGLPPASPELTALDAAWPWWKRSAGTLEACAIELPSDVEARSTWAIGNSRYRSEVRRRRRKAERDFGNCEIKIDDTLQAHDWNDIAELHGRRQEAHNAAGRNRYSVFEDAIEGPAFRAAMRWAENRGAARYYRLLLGGELAAFQVSTYFNDQLNLSVMGFEPKFHAYAPFKILMGDIAKDAIDGGFHVVDCGSGLSALKKEYCNVISTTECRLLLHPSIRGRMRAHAWDAAKGVWDRAQSIFKPSD